MCSTASPVRPRSRPSRPPKRSTRSLAFVAACQRTFCDESLQAMPKDPCLYACRESKHERCNVITKRKNIAGATTTHRTRSRRAPSYTPHTRRRAHTPTDPVHRRPQTPRRNTSRTPARASRRVRSPISRRRSPAANSTRARATGPRCPSAARDRPCGGAIDSAAPSDRRSPPLAAPRCGRTSDMQRKRPARMGTHVPAENEHGYMINQPRGSMRASKRQGTGERAWKGAPRGDGAHRRKTLRARVD